MCWEWNEFGPNYYHYGYLQHLTAQGTVAPGWPLHGVPAAAEPNQFDPQLASDQAGGAIVLWDESQLEPERRLGLFAQRFAPDGTTATLLALASASAAADRVRLEWQGAGAGALAAWVERRTAAEEWQRVGVAVPAGTDRLRYEDQAVIPGARYAYRLGYLEEGAERLTAETWVEVPAVAALALEGFRPNPARGEPVVRFTLPAAAPARLELYDVGGRRILGREVGGLGAGRHALRLSGGSELAPGVYLVRLHTTGQTLVARGIVVR